MPKSSKITSHQEADVQKALGTLPHPEDFLFCNGLAVVFNEINKNGDLFPDVWREDYNIPFDGYDWEFEDWEFIDLSELTFPINSKKDLISQIIKLRKKE